MTQIVTQIATQITPERPKFCPNRDLGIWTVGRPDVQMHKSHHPNRAPNSISNPNVLQVTVVTRFVIKILVATVNAHQINPKSGPNKCGIWMIRGTQIRTIWVVICVGFGPTVNAPSEADRRDRKMK